MSHGTPLQDALKSLAALSPAADKLPYFNNTGSSAGALADLTAAGRALLDDADASAQRTTMGVAIGSDVQAYDAGLADIAGLAVTDGNIIVGDGANWVAESGATARTSLGVAIGSDVQAHGDVLDDLNTLGAPSADGEFLVATGAGAFAYESGATARTSMGLGTGDSPTFTSLTLSGQAGALAMNSQKITGLGTPTADGDAATKGYVDSQSEGLDIKGSVECIATSNVNLGSASSPLPIDGVTPGNNEFILLAGQSTASENGRYKMVTATDPTTWVRSDDMAAGSNAAGAFMFVSEGTVNADTGWVCSSNTGADVVGTDDLAFVQFSSAGVISAGDGLDKTGNVMSLDLQASGGLQIVSTELAVKVADFAGAGLEAAAGNLRIASGAAGNGLKGGSGVALSVEPADFAGSGLEDDGSDNLRIAAAAAGAGLTGGGGSALAVDYTAAADWSGKQTTDARALKYRTITTTTTLAADDDVIIWNGGSNGDLDLPAASGQAGRRIHVKNIHASSSCTIDPNGTELIDGAASKVLDTQYQSVILVCDGVGWFIF